jgi:hypothetical protein
VLRRWWVAANSTCCIYPSYVQTVSADSLFCLSSIYRANLPYLETGIDSCAPWTFTNSGSVPSFLYTVHITRLCSVEQWLRRHGKISSCYTLRLYLRTLPIQIHSSFAKKYINKSTISTYYSIHLNFYKTVKKWENALSGFISYRNISFTFILYNWLAS